MPPSSVPTSALPWISALLLGASAHVGWLVHALEDHDPPTVKVIAAPAAECPEVEEAPSGERMPDVIVEEVAQPESPEPLNERMPPALPTDAIHCPSEDLCIVDSAFVDSLLQNPARLAKQARVVPSIKDGQTHGFKLYGIRRGTLPNLLGLKNGDLITGINDTKLTSIDACMSLYAKMKRASELDVHLERKGKPLTKRIEIR